MPTPSTDVTQFIGCINNWAVNQSTPITLAMNTSAQWEVWLQVELAVFLKTNLGATVVREVKYDGSQQSVDLVVKVNDRAIAVELKTESLKTGNVSGTTMVNALRSDTQKLKDNQLLVQYMQLGCKKWSSVVIGIGQVAKYAATASKIIGAATSCLKFSEDFGLYSSVVAESD